MGKQDAKLQLSGTLSFGADGNKITGEDNATKRQDIYITGYLGNEDGKPILATSLVITGALTDPKDKTKGMSKGSIWVGAEEKDNEPDNHYDTLKQFAVFAENLVTGGEKLTSTQLTQTAEAFRNATTSEEYYGKLGDDAQCIYWDGTSGIAKVILKKVGYNKMSLRGAAFSLYKDNSSTPYVVKHEGADDETLDANTLQSNASGIIWIGELPYGTYYLEECNAPAGYTSNENKWFCLIVDETGTWMASKGYNDNDSDAANKAKAAEDAGNVKSKALTQTN